MTIDSLIQQRLTRPGQNLKVKALAQQSASGSLTSFQGLFRVGALAPAEEASLRQLVTSFAPPRADTDADLQALMAITAEVKAISHQAALLHGERIKRAQELLTPYREGAFTAYLIAAYGNRQTPYNFLLYFEFIEALPVDLKSKAEALPKQVIYTLASRKAPMGKKFELISTYAGETKAVMLSKVRELFPLAPTDQRGPDYGGKFLLAIAKLTADYQRHKHFIDLGQRKEIAQAVKTLLQVL